MGELVFATHVTAKYAPNMLAGYVPGIRTMLFPLYRHPKGQHYRFGRKVWMAVVSVRLSVRFLLEIRLARTLGYFLTVSKEPILTDWNEVASSYFLRVSSVLNLIRILLFICIVSRKTYPPEVKLEY